MCAHSADPERWLKVTEHGLYCEPGNFYVDPSTAVDRAVITHGHADHARPGHKSVLATPATLAIMRARYGADAARAMQALDYGDGIGVAGVRVRLAPAGHVLGSAQVMMEHGGVRVVVSGDYKRQPDPTCLPFEPMPCDVFITEATFGLPVFRHPPAADEIARLLASLRRFPERTHLVGAYALGKAQRIVMLLRSAGYDAPIYIHGALANLCALYRRLGVGLGELRPVGSAPAEELVGAVVVAPPSALSDRWSRRLADPVRAMASGWMRVRARARQRGAELPLVISDHADWDELSATLHDVGAPRVWVTHGREEALVHHARRQGFDARALYLLGREEEGE